MPYLMHIAFDNSNRLDRYVYYFKYKGIKFKLIQNIQKYKDVLLTILSESNGQEGKIYKIACEYLSALSWQNGAMVIITCSGGASRREITLRKAKCSMFDFREIPRGYHSGRDYSILMIPKIENDRQGKALALFRYAFANLNPYFSFLFYWHIVGVGEKKPSEWIDDHFSKGKLHIPKQDLSRLPVGNLSVGNYMYDDCRNAIAHITRLAGRKRLEVDDLDDQERFYISARVMEGIARFYIKHELGLDRRLYLVRKVRKSSRGFPQYLAEDDLRKGSYVVAYEKKFSAW